MAAPQNSTFRFTDTNVTPFVVKPFTANGPQNPSSSALYTNPDGVGAVSANTSLVLVGRGTPYYGEVIQSNMVYMLEHFSNKSRPVFPIIGQVWYKKQNYTDPNFPTDPTTKGLYLWTGTSWDPIQMKGTASTSELNMGGFRILNVGDPSSPQDAVNLRAGDARYVRATGSDMDGTFIVLSGSLHVDNGARLSCDDMPTDPPHVVNLQYLDLVSNALSADISSVNQRIDNFVTNGGAYAPTTGATFTGNVILTSTATLTLQSGGSALSLNGRKISDVGTPVAPTDVATKSYVDGQITTVNTAISATNSSIVTLQSDLATIYAAKSGATFVGDVNISSAANFTLVGATASAAFGGRRIQHIADPVNTDDAATKHYVDIAVSTTHKNKRYVYVQSGSATVVNLPISMGYVCGSHTLQVFKNGLKMVTNLHTQVAIAVTGTALTAGSDTGLTGATVYNTTVTVDGGTATALSITTPPGTTSFSTLVSLLNTAAATASQNVLFEVDAYSATQIAIVARTFSTGPSGTSSLVISNAVGTLFNVLPNVLPFVTTQGATYGYAENGNLGTTSTQITFTTAPTNGDIIEFILS